jgi:hypothetical protein
MVTDWELLIDFGNRLKENFVFAMKPHWGAACGLEEECDEVADIFILGLLGAQPTCLNGTISGAGANPQK